MCRARSRRRSAGSRRPESRRRRRRPRARASAGSRRSRACDELRSTPRLVEVLDVGARRGRSSITASVNERVSRVVGSSRSAASPTARSSVRDAERRFRPSASMQRRGQQHRRRIDDAEAGVVVGLARRRGRTRPGPRRAATPARPTTCEPANVRRRVDERRRRVASVDDHVERLRARRAGGRALSPSVGLLDLEPAPAAPLARRRPRARPASRRRRGCGRDARRRT